MASSANQIVLVDIHKESYLVMRHGTCAMTKTGFRPVVVVKLEETISVDIDQFRGRVKFDGFFYDVFLDLTCDFNVRIIFDLNENVFLFWHFQDARVSPNISDDII